MKHFIQGLLAAFVLVAALGAASVRPTEPFNNPPVTSYRVVPFDSLNAEIARAAAAGEAWPHDPVLVGLHAFSSSPEALEERSDLTVHWKGRPEEHPKTGELVIVEQDPKDDAEAGEWQRFEMAKLPDRTWRVTTHYAATRCWRGPHAGSFTRELCP
jgi:hypothetical protein